MKAKYIPAIRFNGESTNRYRAPETQKNTAIMVLGMWIQSAESAGRELNYAGVIRWDPTAGAIECYCGFGESEKYPDDYTGKE